MLGDGTAVDAVTTPLRVPLTDVRDFSLSQDHTCAVRANGELHCFGFDVDGALGSSTGTSLSPQRVEGMDDIRRVVVAHASTCVLRATNEIACFGRVDGGGATHLSPDVVTGLPDERILDLSHSSGTAAKCAVIASGRMYCWGSANSFGDLGVGTQAPVSGPTQVLTYDDFTRVSNRDNLGCGIRDRHRAIACWGRARRVGDGTEELRSSPVDVVDFP